MLTTVHHDDNIVMYESHIAMRAGRFSKEVKMKARAVPTEPVAFRVPVDWKRRAQKAASVRDGDNLSRLVRRAVDRLIEEEQLLESEKEGKAA